MKSTILFILLFFTKQICYSQNENLFDLVRNGSVKQIENFLKTNPKSIDSKNSNGFTALILSCYRGNNEVAKLLIDSGCDININTEMGTALMASVVKGNNEISKYLISRKAKLDLQDNNGVNALMYAVQFKNYEIVELLLKNDADKSIKDKNGKTAFEYAVFTGDERIINLLK